MSGFTHQEVQENDVAFGAVFVQPNCAALLVARALAVSVEDAETVFAMVPSAGNHGVVNTTNVLSQLLQIEQ